MGLFFCFTPLPEALSPSDPVFPFSFSFFDQLPAELKSDLDLKIVLASLYVSDGNYDMAIKVADEVLALDEGNLDALEIKTLCAKAKGDSTAYKAAAKAILATDPYNAQINIMEGDEQAINHKWKLARDAYSKALKSEPDNADALFSIQADRLFCFSEAIISLQA